MVDQSGTAPESRTVHFGFQPCRNYPLAHIKGGFIYELAPP
jgi:hypothetical protein